MNTLSYKTRSVKKEEVVREWFEIDVAGLKVGRVASQIASILRGKHKPTYTPHVDAGDYVIVLNADKIVFSGAKWDQKEYISYSLYPGGQKRVIAGEMQAKKPHFIVENAVKGMLPKNKLGRAMLKKLFVYTGTEHTHVAQKPKRLEIK